MSSVEHGRALSEERAGPTSAYRRAIPPADFSLRSPVRLKLSLQRLRDRGKEWEARRGADILLCVSLYGMLVPTARTRFL